MLCSGLSGAVDEIFRREDGQLAGIHLPAKKRAAEAGLQMHKKVADAAAFLIDSNLRDLFEVNVVVNGLLLSAPLKKQFLRDDEFTFVHKYSRVTSSDFTLIGLVTQKGVGKTSVEPIPDVKDASNLKSATRTIALHMRVLEESFGAPLENEIVIDPFAIYSVLSL
ncbi:MAG: hypothetical protein EON58_22910 [Alphaproteobacteria bacterium]|nr:MAG: hypothetical protein EON58_22910 [Alphaproteobacteria bacterium]